MHVNVLSLNKYERNERANGIHICNDSFSLELSTDNWQLISGNGTQNISNTLWVLWDWKLSFNADVLWWLSSGNSFSAVHMLTFDVDLMEGTSCGMLICHAQFSLLSAQKTKVVCRRHLPTLSCSTSRIIKCKDRLRSITREHFLQLNSFSQF